MQHALKFAEQPRLPFADYALPDPTKGWNGLVLVGEAPGAEEARLGRPFVGRSGQLLDKMLEQAGIDRARCIIANVFRFQPPGNKVNHFFTSRRAALAQGIGIAETYGKFGSTFCRADFASEIAQLGAMLTQKNPALIVALGRTPLWALTGENGLLNKVGQMLPCRLSAGKNVLPTFHPSFILRGNWKLQDEWAGHFQKASKFSK